ncbi:hypothetical protein B7463_g5900, partial [Scytalidium lignicola]
MAGRVTSLPPEINVIIGDTTWMLPFNTSIELPQTDGSTITLSPQQVEVGSQTFAVPSATATTSLSAGGVSVTFQPGPSPNSSPPSGGLVVELQALQPAAGAVSFIISEITAARSSRISSATSDSDFSVLGSLLNSSTSVPRQFNLLQSLKKLVSSGVTALNTFRPIIRQFFTSGAAFAIVAPEAISLIANSNYNTTENNNTLPLPSQPYLLATYTDTRMVVFKFFILALPDQGNGAQIVYPHIPWQTYLTNLTVAEAAAIKLLPFIETVELNSDLDDSGFGAIQNPK